MKIKSISFFLVLLLFANQFLAQDNIDLFAEEGTVWSIGAFNAPYQLTNLDYLWLYGNTQEDEFDEDYYHIVRIGESYPPTLENIEIAFYIRIAEDSVLHLSLDEITSFPIFDYKLEVGAEADLYMFDYYTESFESVSIEVENVESVSTLSGTKKSWTIVSEGASNWIQGIGNKEGLIYANYGLHGWTGVENLMICAFNGEDHLYQNSLFDNCYITDIDDFKVSNDKLIMYPNPVTDNLYVESEWSIISIELYDCAGRIVYNKLVDSNKMTVDFSEFENGIYFLKLFSDNEIRQRTIIKI